MVSGPASRTARAAVFAGLVAGSFAATASDGEPVAETAFPEWMQVEVRPRADAVAAWRAIREIQHAEWKAGGGPGELAEAVSSVSGQDERAIRARVEQMAGDGLWYNSLRDQIRWDEGPHAGYWQFFGRHGDEEGPTAAFRFDWPITGSTYTLPVRMYCDAALGGCDEVRAALASFKAMEPSDPVLFEQWTQIVASEACEPGPVNMKARGHHDPGRSGRVSVFIRTNRCGEVRDAWIAESSGDEELDRLALSDARRWRVELPDLPEGAVENVFKVPFSYGTGTPARGD